MGNIDAIFFDKTGTLTQNEVEIEGFCDLNEPI
jgi:P-type E1-E2 ATPase